MRGKKRTPEQEKLLAEASPIIEKIAARMRGQTFAYFEADDVAQEVRIICLRVLNKYNPQAGLLENYLQKCVTNRLKNLKRDRYFRPTLGEANGARNRINIVNALPLGGGDIPPSLEGRPMGSASFGSDPLQNLVMAEMETYLNEHLAEEDRTDLERLRSGERLAGPRVDQLRGAVRAILEQYDNG